MRPRTLCAGDLVLKSVECLEKGLSASKVAPKWEGPCVIIEAYNSCYFLILPHVNVVELYCPESKTKSVI